ncbi:unnamed protein product, partial [Heterotrigona itama]
DKIGKKFSNLKELEMNMADEWRGKSIAVDDNTFLLLIIFTSFFKDDYNKTELDFKIIANEYSVKFIVPNLHENPALIFSKSRRFRCKSSFILTLFDSIYEQSLTTRQSSDSSISLQIKRPTYSGKANNIDQKLSNVCLIPISNPRNQLKKKIYYDVHDESKIGSKLYKYVPGTYRSGRKLSFLWLNLTSQATADRQSSTVDDPYWSTSR